MRSTMWLYNPIACSHDHKSAHVHASGTGNAGAGTGVLEALGIGAITAVLPSPSSISRRLVPLQPRVKQPLHTRTCYQGIQYSISGVQIKAQGAIQRTIIASEIVVFALKKIRIHNVDEP